MSWPNRKLSDNSSLLAEHARDVGDPEKVEEDALYPTMTVDAPCCGRRCAGDMVCLIPGVGWKCDACRARLRRDPDTEWTKPKLMRAMGAPAGEVRHEAVKRRARRRFVEAKRRDEGPVSRRTFIDEVDDELPDAAQGYPPGTEPPGA